MSRTIPVLCRQCQKPFSYPLKEYNRQTKLGRTKHDLFCGITCVMKWRNSHRSSEEQAKISLAISKRSKGNQYNKKGTFTFYLNKSRNRKKGKYECDLDEDFLKDLWGKQNGKCPISGVNIQIKKGKNTPFTASLDRIDSNKGYVKGNVQFVAYSVNLAKNAFNNDEILKFFSCVRHT